MIWQFSYTNGYLQKMPYTFWLRQFSPNFSIHRDDDHGDDHNDEDDDDDYMDDIVMTMMTINLPLPDQYKAAPSAVIKLHLKLNIIIIIIIDDWWLIIIIIILISIFSIWILKKSTSRRFTMATLPTFPLSFAFDALQQIQSHQNVRTCSRSTYSYLFS